MYGHTPTEFSVEMLTKVINAGNGVRGKDSPPWVLLAEYVAEIERRLAELEAKANSSELHLPKD